MIENIPKHIKTIKFYLKKIENDVENVFDFAFIISHGCLDNNENWEYTVDFKGDPTWLRKKIDYKLLPSIEEAIEDLTEQEEND